MPRAQKASPPHDAHVFVSYAHDDASFVTRLSNDLQGHGIAVWVDRSGLTAATPNWQRAIREAIAQARAFLLVASPHAIRSDVVLGEVSVARDCGIPISVVWAEGATWSACVPLELVKVQYADCRPPAYYSGLDQLVRALMKRNDRPPTDPNLKRGMRQTPLRVLVFSANPENTTAPVNGVQASRAPAIEQATGNTPVSDTVEVEVEQYFAAKLHQIATLLARADPSTEFEIVHLSGYDIVPEPSHRPPREAMDDETPNAAAQPFSARYLAEVLSSSLPSRVRLLIIVSRLSRQANATEREGVDPGECPWIDAVATSAPYVLTIEWNPTPRPSETATEALDVFLTCFYETYLQSRSIDKSVNDASLQVRIRALDSWIRVTLRKRVYSTHTGNLLIDARIPDLPDPLTIDLTLVKDRLARLGLPVERVFDLLARKIRAHRIAFSTPRDKAILSVDSVLHGEFSWNAPAGVITCTRLFRFRSDVDPRHWDAWYRMLAAYNDLRAEVYREAPDPRLPTEQWTVERGLHRFRRKFDTLDTTVTVLEDIGYKQVWMPFSDCRVHLETAEEKFIEQEYGQSAAFLDLALSCLHTMVEMCVPPTEADTAE